MRLIDADELIEVVRWSEVCRLSLKEIISIIDNAPTIDTQTELTVARSQGYECGFAEGYEEGFAKGKERPKDYEAQETIKEILCIMGEETNLYREETCDRKTHCTDYKYWHCIGCNGCKHREANNE